MATDRFTGYIRGKGGKYAHRAIMEETIGRPLLPSEEVHHKDRNRRNNSPDNLVLMSRSEHLKRHAHTGEKPDGKPIIFSARTARLILDGKKTQFRVPIALNEEELSGRRRPYVEGNMLYVREPWRESKCYAQEGWDCGHDPKECPIWQKTFMYAADGNPCNPVCKYTPAIYMSPLAARIFLRVTGVRVERLQDIESSDADIGEPDEGCAKFRELWDALNVSKGFGWHLNPWVLVVDFERCAGPFDRRDAALAHFAKGGGAEV